ncbi:MAG: HAD family phosphatase [Cyclobacteriaceae bacterium]|jgi:epoxide hydrolase-like predicted phosphatase|nr:HAD family phosphatase [Cyclobacteriaceae bacterium]
MKPRLDLKKYKVLLFDLGGVILNLSFEKTYQSFTRLLDVSIDQIKKDFVHQTFFKDFEIGKISDHEFRLSIQKFAVRKLMDAEIDHAWNAMLGNLPLRRIEVLQKLKSSYQLILFSNTNHIHLQAFKQICIEAGIHDFDACFNQAYYSHLVGKRKPDQATYQWICNQHDFYPSDVLFFDDSELNLQGAEAIGIHTFLVNDTDELFQELGKQV